ncbi:MAG TPA: 3-hydroxyacyl-CoA dehydrogenase NAD-binding domain-containing protein [Flavobacteriales bacterium]|nr:3-hydroxyacyl-CoA dehydrogenase NAD-binding domain-containing protein [Flavobacteriales bacterium]
MEQNTIVGVIGAGTMGSGIAQVAAQAGHTCYLYDANSATLERALTGLRGTIDKLVAKGKITAEEGKAITDRLRPATNLKDLAPCGLVIEAIIEDLAVKKKVFTDLEAFVAEDAVLATNTSSLSVTAIAAACSRPERVIGLHFFNPAPLLPLVEVVPGLATEATLASRLMALMQAWGKTPVVCKDTPGFIVNRVARPFYGEAIRIFEEGIADMPTIDAAMKSAGFKMGPFELMDLIGNDINFTVTRTVWEAFFYDPRYKPSFTQQRQVESGRLGRKSGRGYYSYADGAMPAFPAVDGAVSTPIVERILAMLINEAADALFWQVASAQDIDLAMTKGVNYPKGLLAWADEQGAAHWLGVLQRLQATYGEDRYRPSPLLLKASTDRSSLR